MLVDDGDYRRLWSALRHATIEQIVLDFVTRAAHKLGPAHPVVRALHAAFSAPAAYLTVGEIAVAVDRGRRTLYDDWTSLFGTESPMSLHDALNWIVLLKALEAKDPRVGWEQTLDDLGVPRSRMERFVSANLGCGLHDAETNEYPRVLHEFQARFASLPG